MIQTCFISTLALLEAPSKQGVTFVLQSLDPKRTLQLNPFLYVHSENELLEKLALLHSDKELQQELL